MKKASWQALILAGGLGTRFWPRSTPQRPKQFLDFDGKGSLLRQTAARLHAMFAWEDIWVITQKEHHHLALRHLPHIPEVNILLEPCLSGTAAAIAWAAAHISHYRPGSILGIFPSDHRIDVEDGRFFTTLETAFRLAEKRDVPVLIGLAPTRHETQFGYIKKGTRKGSVNNLYWYEAEAFHEKPDRTTAAGYVASGRYLRNTGMVVAPSLLLTELIPRVLPELKVPMENISANIGTRDYDRAVAVNFPCLPDCSFDQGVLEKIQNALVLASDFGWEDLGSWPTYAEKAPRTPEGNVVEGCVQAEDCLDSLMIAGKGKTLAAIGLRGMAVIIDGDSVLVCPRDRLDEVRNVVTKIC